MEEILIDLGLENVPEIKVPERLISALKEFELSHERFLVLWGPPGTYKTTAVKQFLKALAEKKYAQSGKVRSYDIRFVRFVDMPKIWKEEEEVFYRTKLLAIDDLVLSPDLPGNFLMELFSLIDYRYTQPCKTIITTNHDLTNFLNGEVSFQQRIASRLCDANLSKQVFSKVSYRTPHKPGGNSVEW
jgi:DNA replication protein DnaC